MRLGYISKAARAGALAQGARRQPVKAAPVVLSRGMSQAAAFRAIALACMLHMQANEAGFMAGLDPEYLHQMRVAVRRLRSAFAVFRQRMPADRLAPVADEARMLARQLGTARDWDVFATETMRAIVGAFGGD
ncbi:MAG: CHAD domain-containing protein, partial [Alphaproteobacteria bacterium]|nr:CHAD domain-containing protein [Alphaproteobacteria bacterium]